MRRKAVAAAVAAMSLWLAGAFAQTSASDFASATRYDAARRVTGTIAPDPDGSGSLHYAAVRTTYDASGNVTLVEKGELSAWQSEAVAPATWSGFTVSAKVATTYDALGRKLVEASWGWDSATAGWVESGVTQYSYDALGRLECTAVRMNPAAWGSLPASACTLGTSGSFGPDRIARSIYDAVGQVLKVQKAVGTPLQQDYATYTYSANGKVLSVKDANGNVSGYVYDGFDRLATWSFPSTAATGSVSTTDYEQYGYDANGNRTSLRKRDGRTLGYTYDALNRVTVKSVPGACVSGFACTPPPASAVRDVYYGYDLRGLQTYARFDSASGADTVDNAYDGFGRLSSQTTAMYGVSRTVSYLYDADGNRIRITHPDGVYFTYDYDGLDRAAAVKENGATTIATMTYDAGGRQSGETRNLVATTFGYDGTGRLTSLADDLPGGTANDLSTTFEYNPASQLVGRTRSNPAPYAFDGYVDVSRPYTTNGLNQYGTAGSATFGYDANGNLTSDGATGYTYDVENRLVATSLAGTVLVYDPLGRLYNAGAASASKSVVYDGDLRILDYAGSASVIARRYVLGPGADNVLLYYEGSGLTDRRALQADERGSITSVVDASGTLLGINAYDEYGIRDGAKLGRYGYTGQVWVETVGMRYYKARFYSPTLGRFAQTDPIGYDDGLNWYAYVANDPVNNRDPSGECTENTCPVSAIWGSTDYNLQVRQTEEKAGAVGVPILGGIVAATVAVATDGFGLVPLAKLASRALGIGERAAPKTLGNPFKGKTLDQAGKMMERKGFEHRGPSPQTGRGGYVNPKTGRSYRVDPGVRPVPRRSEPPHVDVNRDSNLTPRSDFPKRKFPLE